MSLLLAGCDLLEPISSLLGPHSTAKCVYDDENAPSITSDPLIYLQACRNMALGGDDDRTTVACVVSDTLQGLEAAVGTVHDMNIELACVWFDCVCNRGPRFCAVCCTICVPRF
jgi:hypothetical protein